MYFMTTEDGTQIYYKDWGEDPGMTFSRGWPLNSDICDEGLSSRNSSQEDHL